MAEKCVGKGVVVKSGDIDTDQLALSFTESVDCLGNQFLTDSTLAKDQNRLA